MTRDFGRGPLVQLSDPKVGANDTLLSLLARNAPVRVGAGGRLLSAAGATATGPLRWSAYLNGVATDERADKQELHPGDFVWWDLHDARVAPRVKAVVGAFPEPFRHGPDGKRLPVRVECVDPQTAACDAAQKAMTSAGVLAAQGGLQTSLTKQTLRILVGPYRQLREDDAVGLLEQGPAKSGVFARPSPDGRRIALLDDRGHVTQTVAAGSGLIAATRLQGNQPVWIVTGTDARGVDAASSALDEADLRNRFALAVAGGRGIPVPEGAPR